LARSVQYRLDIAGLRLNIWFLRMGAHHSSVWAEDRGSVIGLVLHWSQRIFLLAGWEGSWDIDMINSSVLSVVIVGCDRFYRICMQPMRLDFESWNIFHII
jgi:hypothetical protein